MSRVTDSNINLRPYIVGYVLSLAFTLGAYIMVVQYHSQQGSIIALISILALLQLVTQLFCFLHLGSERGPRWKLGVFVFMVGIVFIIVAGSLWIMSNLNYHMTPAQVNNYLNQQGGI